ncbi:hypothetical protein GA0115246_113799 [Streptomyces sp. SolWspMP-sol7th]|nr:hypothetical protein GA0115246_113799 [Streptomyces sp. SolWspMP-sol7th]
MTVRRRPHAARRPRPRTRGVRPRTATRHRPPFQGRRWAGRSEGSCVGGWGWRGLPRGARENPHHGCAVGEAPGAGGVSGAGVVPERQTTAQFDGERGGQSLRALGRLSARRTKGPGGREGGPRESVMTRSTVSARRAFAQCRPDARHPRGRDFRSWVVAAARSGGHDGREQSAARPIRQGARRDPSRADIEGPIAGRVAGDDVLQTAPATGGPHEPLRSPGSLVVDDEPAVGDRLRREHRRDRDVRPPVGDIAARAGLQLHGLPPPRQVPVARCYPGP